MRIKTALGLVLVTLGLTAIVYTTLDWTERDHHNYVPLILGAIALAGGIAVLLVRKKGVFRLASSR